MFLAQGHRDEPLALDCFGLVNQQTHGRPLTFAIDQLMVNGRRVDLARDPGWEGRGNHARFQERDFHARRDFGHSRTSHAGGQPGELGGRFWRTEPEDPLHGYHAVDVGVSTLNDPIRFSGRVGFVEGQPDSGVALGYFRASLLAPITDPAAAHPPQNTLGLEVEGPTRLGFHLSERVAPSRATASGRDGPLLEPDRAPRRFTFDYDPQATDGVGRVVFTLDGKETRLDPTPAQRAAGARFGLWSLRRGGKVVELHVDDLEFTSRRSVVPRQPIGDAVVVPFPPGGRRH